jgi:hypothetical protein
VRALNRELANFLARAPQLERRFNAAIDCLRRFDELSTRGELPENTAAYRAQRSSAEAARIFCEKVAQQHYLSTHASPAQAIEISAQDLLDSYITSDAKKDRHAYGGRKTAELKRGRPSPGALRVAEYERRTKTKITTVTDELAAKLSLSPSQVRRLLRVRRS